MSGTGVSLPEGLLPDSWAELGTRDRPFPFQGRATRKMGLNSQHLLLTTQHQEPGELLAQTLWVQVCMPVLDTYVYTRKCEQTHMSVGVRVCADGSAHGTRACVCGQLWRCTCARR